MLEAAGQALPFALGIIWNITRALDELATFRLHALAGASTLPSKAAVRRLVAVTLAGLRPPG